MKPMEILMNEVRGQQRSKRNRRRAWARSRTLCGNPSSWSTAVFARVCLSAARPAVCETVKRGRAKNKEWCEIIFDEFWWIYALFGRCQYIPLISRDCVKEPFIIVVNAPRSVFISVFHREMVNRASLIKVLKSLIPVVGGKSVHRVIECASLFG